MISSTDYSDVNSSGSSDDESINWECGPSGDLNFFSDRRKVNRKRNKLHAKNKKGTFSRGPGKSSHCRGLTSLPNCKYEIQNPSINSVFDENESIAIDIQSGAESAFEIDQEETLEFVLIEETTDNAPSEPLVNPANDFVVKNTSRDSKKDKTWPPVKSAKNLTVKQIIFLCDNCDISFTSNEDLKEHYATSETCSKKYKCFLCPFSADRNPTIKLHLAFEHNRTEVYSCYHCSDKTGSKQEMKKHIKNKHFKDLSVNELSRHTQSQDSISNRLKINQKKDDEPLGSNQDYKNDEITVKSKKQKSEVTNKTGAMTRSQISYSAKNNNLSFESSKSCSTKLKKQKHKSKISVT